MKKTILTSACILAAAGAAFAQGTVSWQTISFASFTTQTNDTVVSYMSPGQLSEIPAGQQTQGPTLGNSAGSFFYELLYNTAGTTAPTTKAQLDTWSDTGLEAENTTYVQASSTGGGRAQVVNSQAAAVVPFTGTMAIMMVGWSANLGTTWSAALADLNAGSGWTGLGSFGQTSVGSLTPFASGTDPGQNPIGSPGIVSTLTQLNALAPVPEPTTLALGALGGLSLLALRRKKA